MKVFTSLAKLYGCKKIIYGPTDLHQLKDVKNDNIYAFNLVPLHIQHAYPIIEKLNKSSKHYSFQILFQHILCDWAKNLEPHLCNYNYVFNIPVFVPKDTLVIKGINEESSDLTESMPYGSINALMYHIWDKPWAKTLGLIKILTGSFFLSEVFEITNLTSEYNLDSNMFFNNFGDFKKFAKNIIHDSLQVFDFCPNVLDAAMISHQLFNTSNDTIIDLDFIIQHDLTFAYKALVYKDISLCNTQYYRAHSMKLPPTTINNKRKLVLPANDYEKYGDPYGFYMQKILGVKYKSITSIQRKAVQEFLVNNLDISQEFWMKPSIWSFLQEIKPKITMKDKMMYMDNLPSFMVICSGAIPYVKRQARLMNHFSFYMIDIYHLEVKIINVRPIKIPHEVVVNY